MQLALKHHQKLELQQAEAIYRQVLQLEPNNAEALHLLGVIALQRGQNEIAVGLIEKAIKVNQTAPLFHHNAGNAYRALNKLEEAIACYQRALSLKPDFYLTHNSLGSALQEQGKADEAVAHYKRAATLKPDYLEAHYNLGVAFQGQGKLDEAIACYQHALSIKPDYWQALNNMGNTLKSLGKLEEAVACYHRALSIKPDYYEALNNLGIALQDSGKLEEAVACYHRALSLKPDRHEVLNNLGNALIKGYGKVEEAIACYHRALSIKPDYSQALINLGNALKEQGRLDEAIAHYNRAIALKPDNEEAYNNLGNVLNKQGKLQEATACYQKALELKDNYGVRIKLATLLPAIMPSREDISLYRRQLDHSIDDLLLSGVVLNDPLKDVGQTNFYLAYHGINNRDLQVKIANFYINVCPSLLYVAPHCKNERGIGKSGKIKIGFISSNFCEHTIGKHFRGVIANLSRELFEVYVFFDKKKSDGIAQFIEKNADRSVTLVSSLEIARKQVSECELDILFYTDIGMDPLTYFLSFSRLAPVQCVTWGHPDTTGVPNLDYFISCEDFEAEGSQTQYSEALVRMTQIPNYFYRPDAVELTGTREIIRRMGLPDDKRLYVVPQTLFKFHPDFDAVLAEILRRDRNGLLILFEVPQEAFSTLLRDRFHQSIPDVAERIIFLPFLAFNDFISFISSADAVLDPPYFCGGTTSLELFSVGCPIVTWPTDRMASRFTYAYYKKMGVMDLVCQDSEQYIQCAVRLANDADWKRQISEKMLERNGILYNNPDSVRELEQFLLYASTTAASKGKKKEMKDFIFDKTSGIYTYPGASLEYSDSSEAYLLNVFRNLKDVTSYSSELLPHIKDWPTTYHLSLRRANILKAVLDLFDRDTDVLELGSGCGAITRWLGESFHGVDAVEGNQLRALVTRERTRDLSNVQVYCGDIMDISFSHEKYGLVSLIGVLEYIPLRAKRHASRETTCIDFLQKLKSSLREDGVLLIAIENKFGAKYFSGCKEDHTNRLFEGLIGYPNHTPVTFGRDELRVMLTAAGFENIQFYHVFPDYKLPQTFIKEDDETLSLSLYNWIKTPFEDHSDKRLNLIPEPLFLQNLTKARLLWHFSNSFLLLASKSGKKNLSAKWQIKKFSNDEIYNTAYHHVVTLQKDENKNYFVTRQPLTHGKASFSTQNTSFNLNETDRFLQGDLLIFEAYRAFVSQNSVNSIIDIMRKLHGSLLSGYSKNRKDDEGYDLVDGSAVDYVLWNLMSSPDNGSISFIDRKWRFKDELPADYILFRSLGCSFLVPFIKDNKHVPFILSVMNNIYPGYTKERLAKNLALEASFQSELRINRSNAGA